MMNNLYELVCPCHFGLEAVLKREIYDLGYDISKVDNGRVYFEGDDEAIARANVNLRTAERVMICVGEFQAVTFTELFDQVAELEWERFIPKDGKFWVTKASSVNSKLFSGSDIQSIVKKAIVSRLSKKYNISWFEETGNEYPIKIMILKDKVSVCIRIPMREEYRSLNLSNSVAIIAYEAMRQNQFKSLEEYGELHRLKWDK